MRGVTNCSFSYGQCTKKAYPDIKIVRELSGQKESIIKLAIVTGHHLVIFRLKLVGWDVVGVPIVNINKSRRGLIMVAVHRAFYHVIILTAQGNDRPRPAIFAAAARNGFGYDDITSHEYGDYYGVTAK